MTNFEDMSLEELQKLLSVNTKNPDEVKRIQEISGLTGKNVDGIWGKQTSKAWNNFLDKNQSDIEQAISDEQKYQNAIARGQNSPAAVDLVDFSNQLDEQQQARDVKISQLEAQIEQVKERIARNKRALTGKSYEDVNKKLASLEMGKIGLRLGRQNATPDPTMLWRWQNQRQDTMKANANVKSNEAAKFTNTVDMWKNTRLPEGTAAREQMISNLNAAIRDGRNAGADVSDLLTLKAEWEKKTYGNNSNSSVNYGVGSESEQLAGLLKTALETAKTSAELEQFKKDHPDLKSEQVHELDTKKAELQKKEADKAKHDAFVKWVEKETGKKYNTLSQRMIDTYKRIYANRGK